MIRKTALLTMGLSAWLAFFGLSKSSASLDVGTPAPAVTGTDQDGKTVDFKDLYQKGTTLVYFYPKADTPGCTAEACSLRDTFADLRAKGVQVVGVSEDKEATQRSFKEKYHLPFPLVADGDGKVAAAFGVPTALGMAKRQSFLIKNGKVVWRDLSASTGQQGQDVLKALAGS